MPHFRCTLSQTAPINIMTDASDIAFGAVLDLNEGPAI